MPLSNLDLVNACDSFPYHNDNPSEYDKRISAFYKFRVQDQDATLGYVLPSVAETFRDLPQWKLDDEARTLTLLCGDASSNAERSQIVRDTLLEMRQKGQFKVLAKWRDELYAVYDSKKSTVLALERSASPLFGVVTYGVHLNAFVRTKDGELKIWTPRRARSKQTYGGMLDNAVAGGIAAGEDAFDSLVRECGEEASLPEALVRSKATACGTVTYVHERTQQAGGETDLLQPECQYVYDLELPEDVVPKPGDDEVEAFYLYSIDEVKEALAKGEFKPNCAMVVLEFFIRHGILTPGNERDYIEINSRLHRRLPFPHL